MKKIFLYGFAVVSIALLAACGNKTAAGENGADSVVSDSADVEEVAANDGSIDTPFFTLAIPEGWELNGEPDGKKAEIMTTETVPTYYATVEFLDYRKDLDNWKRLDIPKGMTEDGTIQVGDLTYTVMAHKDDAFYKLNVASIIGDKGAICASFTGDSSKDLQEQKDLLVKVLNAVVLK